MQVQMLAAAACSKWFRVLTLPRSAGSGRFAWSFLRGFLKIGCELFLFENTLIQKIAGWRLL
jgi:hypothetical protein